MRMRKEEETTTLITPIEGVQVIEGVDLAYFAELLQDTLTELMRLTVGTTDKQRERRVPPELRRKPYRREYFCVRAVESHGEHS